MKRLSCCRFFAYLSVLLWLGLCHDAVFAFDPSAAVWIDVDAEADVVSLKAAVESAGGLIVTLTPEGRILAELPPAARAQTSMAAGVRGVERYEAAPLEEAPVEPAPGLGDRPPTPEEREYIDKHVQPAPPLRPNGLSRQRALLDGNETDSLPAVVDNTPSQYFPPIRSQGSQGSCTAWAACYYYNTYTQAMDEGLNAKGSGSGDNSVINSPAFMYNLINGGADNGASTEYAVAHLVDIGCCRWNLMAYNASDWTSWPSEAAWVDALKRRGQTALRIGGSSCTDAQLTEIKQHLANGFIAATRTAVYSNWYPSLRDDPARGIQGGTLFDHTGESYIGGHAMTIVGYDDNRPYFDGTQTRHGAFLIANSWGNTWGTTNTLNQKGYLWVAYDYFKASNGCFGVALFNSDRDNYRPALYACAGLNNLYRGYLTYRAGVGNPAAPVWTSYAPISWSGGYVLPVNDTKRLAVDLTDGVSSIADFSAAPLFVSLANAGGTTPTATITSAQFYHDLNQDGAYINVSSTDPVVSVAPGSTGYATVNWMLDGLSASPVGSFDTAGPAGGPFTPNSLDYTLENKGAAAMTWTAASSAAWLDLATTQGTLAPAATALVTASIHPTAAASLTPGAHAATLTFTNSGTAIAQRRAVTLQARPATAFVWNAISSPRQINAPIPVSITAVDSMGMTVTAYEGTTIALRGVRYQGQTTIGTGTGSWTFPLRTWYHDARTQIIYPSSQIAYSGPIASLALDVTTLPRQRLNHWTLRMKHTSLTSYDASPVWEDTGWTVVYQSNENITATGWVTFAFTTPFNYNGSENLMVDFSFDNDSYSADGACRYTSNADYRSITGQTDSAYGDPLTWVGTTPTPSRSMSAPNIRLVFESGVAITPTEAGPFVDGSWSGAVTPLELATSVCVRAVDANGNAIGDTNSFDVELVPVTLSAFGIE